MASIQDFIPSGVVNRTSPTGGAVFSSVMPATAQPTLSPTAKYIADMQALMSGGIGKLSTGEKISALGQVLQAAGSRGATDPAAVLQNVRNQQMQKLNAQFQIAQLQQKALEEENFIKTLTPSERNMFAILDETGKRQYMLARQQGREETDTEKKLRAAGIDPASPEGQKILRNVASAQGIITISGPYGDRFKQASDVIFGGDDTLPDAATIQQDNAAKLQKAVGLLRSGKGTVEQFESIFGKGTAAQYLGGGSGNTTGGFRRR
jgi:hypothetical protein